MGLGACSSGRTRPVREDLSTLNPSPLHKQMPSMHVLARMERRGMAIDVAALRSQHLSVRDALSKLDSAIAKCVANPKPRIPEPET